MFLNGYRNTGLDCHSLALCEWITSIAYSDILEVAGSVSEREMAEIGHAVKVQCGLADKIRSHKTGSIPNNMVLRVMTDGNVRLV